MTSEEFILKWRSAINHLGLPSVGIHVCWDFIPSNSKVETLVGKNAWELVLKNSPPWFKTPQTFQDLEKTKNLDYQQIIKEETENGKIEYYQTNGLHEPHFCIFANGDGSFMLLGDGNHRFLDCIHLMSLGKRNFEKDIEKTLTDIIYLSNFNEVLLPNLIWKESWK